MSLSLGRCTIASFTGAGFGASIQCAHAKYTTLMKSSAKKIGRTGAF